MAVPTRQPGPSAGGNLELQGWVTCGEVVTWAGVTELLGWLWRFHLRLFLVPFQSQKRSRGRL